MAHDARPFPRPRPASAPAPDRLEPPPGVPARVWLDLLGEHPDLVERLRALEEGQEEALAAEVTALLNQRMADEAGDPEDDDEDAEAIRIELLMERYAALVVAGSPPERAAFEREFAPLVELVRDPEGAAIFAEIVAEERALRRDLPAG